MPIASLSTPTELPALKVQPWKRVATCYSVVDRFFPACGLFDLSEGFYCGNPNTPYEKAQTNQHDYLLGQALCGPGQRVLDIGCGYGTLLERARQRGAMGTGITIAPEQVNYCRSRNLDVLPLDYRALPSQWDGTFDCVIANGSIEHFVRPEDTAAGRADGIYRHLFATVHGLIDPNSAARRFVTTTIHVVHKPADPLALRQSPLKFRWGSDDFHRAVLEAGWGGYYPEIGQLRRCAEDYFKLIEEVDGTDDYRLTSEEWLRRVRRALWSWRVVTIALRSLPVLVRVPRQFLALLVGTLVSQSWSWQFQPPNPPMRLLRQSWAYREWR